MCAVRHVSSQPVSIQRKSEQTTDDSIKLQEDIQKVIDQTLSASRGDRNTRISGASDASAHSAALTDLARGRFLDDLPRTLVCLLSGRPDCGPQAEMTEAAPLELDGGPLLALVSALTGSGTCAPGAAGGLPRAVVGVLSGLPLSGALLSGLVDAAVAHMSNFMGTLLGTPMDYIKIALQLGIRTPSLDGQQTCEQGEASSFIRTNSCVPQCVACAFSF